MPQFDIAQVPFSFAGAWLSLSQLAGARAPDGVAGVYLKTHHGGGETPLLRLTPCGPDGAEVPARLTAKPVVLTWEADGGRVECVFASPRVLRLRGAGLGLRLDHHKLLVCYADSPDDVTLNLRPVLRRYQVRRLAGVLEWAGAWTAKQQVYPRVVLRPASDGAGWEAALTEYGSTLPPLDHPPFDACRREAADAFAAWLRPIPEVPPQWAEARRRAAYVQWSAMAEPCGVTRRPAMFMSKNWMAKVWNWDNCFNALSLAAAGRQALAWDQLRLFMDHQDEYGCLPDTLTDQSFHFNFCKPPVHGWTVARLLAHGTPPPETLAAVYRALAAWTGWWLVHRRRAGSPLPYYLHGNDSGWDNATLFDSGRPVVAPDLAAYLVLQCDALATLAERVGEPAAPWRRQADELLAALLARLWCGDRFVGRLADEPDRVVTCDSLICHLPILLGARLPPEVRAALVAQMRRHVTEWGLATEHPASPEYRADGYWRGPIWAPATYLAIAGLRAAGEPTLADDLARRFCAMCAAHGFAENYDARTGAARRDQGYTWSASVFLLLAADGTPT